MRNGRQIDGAIAYFFWMSIIWRMSISEQFNFRLPYNLESHLQEKLLAFINLKEAKQDEEISKLLTTCLFQYRLIDSPDYLHETAGYFGGWFDYNKNILSLTMGDKILCVTFNEDALPDDYSYIGFEEELKGATVNKGLDSERSVIVSTERFAQGIQRMIKETAHKRLLNEKEKADAIWQQLGLPGKGMPNEIQFLI